MDLDQVCWPEVFTFLLFALPSKEKKMLSLQEERAPPRFYPQSACLGQVYHHALPFPACLSFLPSTGQGSLPAFATGWRVG